MFLNCDEARFDGNSELVAELVTVNGFKAAYAIKDGAEGPRGWKVTTATFFLFVEYYFFCNSSLAYACPKLTNRQKTYAEQWPSLDTSKERVELQPE